MTYEDFLNFINCVPKIKQFHGSGRSKAPMSAESFQLLYKMMFYCALKPMETYNLKKEDVDLEKNILRVRTQNKNPTETTIPPIILGDLKKHLKGKKDSDFLFVSKNNEKPFGRNRQAIWEYTRDAGRLAKLKIFRMTEKRKIEGMSLLLFRESYKRLLLFNKAEDGMVELKFRKTSDRQYGGYTLHDLARFEKRIFKTKYNDDEINEYVTWYKSEEPIYEKLAFEVRRILKGLLENKMINIADIQARKKDPEKFEMKLRDGVHYNPKLMQDLAGVRVICFVKSDIKKVQEIIEESFDIIDKKENDETKTNFAGYSDVKYVCKLTKARIASSPELQPVENRRFEIQVRTILQHAWAEIEHDDVYKNAEQISNLLKRRFFLVSNVLETADNELDNLHQRIKEDSKLD